MRWRQVAVQWATVLVLLCVVVAIQIFRPEWTRIDIGNRPADRTSQRGGSYDAIDGDSFRAGKVEVRLHGIDAPEYRQTCKDTAGKTVACGKLSRDALSKLIRDRTVSCTIIDRDRYGRQVSVCKDGKLEINREMVRLGWAVAYRRHALGYVGAERDAKAAKRGIWAWEFEMPEDYRNKNRAIEGSMAGDD
jgi:endonuclease YncB( thermonuclease family)